MPVFSFCIFYHHMRPEWSNLKWSQDALSNHWGLVAHCARCLCVTHPEREFTTPSVAEGYVTPILYEGNKMIIWRDWTNTENTLYLPRFPFCPLTMQSLNKCSASRNYTGVPVLCTGLTPALPPAYCHPRLSQSVFGGCAVFTSSGITVSTLGNLYLMFIRYSQIHVYIWYCYCCFLLVNNSYAFSLCKQFCWC